MYTNKNGRVYKSKWSLPKHGISNREGSTATFSVTNDDTLVWTITEQKRAETPIYAHDTFEEYGLGKFGVAGVTAWKGDGEIKSGTPPSDKWILKRTGVTHNKVLDAGNAVTRSLKAL